MISEKYPFTCNLTAKQPKHGKLSASDIAGMQQGRVATVHSGNGAGFPIVAQERFKVGFHQ